MNTRDVVLRWFVFLAVLGLTLLPGPVGLNLLPLPDPVAALVNLAWGWQILATIPAGIARVDFDGAVWFADTGWLLALVFWGAVGFAAAVGLRRLRLAYFVPAAFGLVFASGLVAYLLLGAFGLSAHVMP